MFDRLLDYILDALDLFRFWVVVEQFESGVILRLGKYHRHLKTGVNWYFPFGIEDYYSDNVVFQTENLGSQSLVTKDGQCILISVYIGYRIKDIKTYLLQVEDATSVLTDSTYGVISENVAEHTWDEVIHPAFHSLVYKEARKKAFRLGVELMSLQFSDLSKSKTLRLINE